MRNTSALSQEESGKGNAIKRTLVLSHIENRRYEPLHRGKAFKSSQIGGKETTQEKFIATVDLDR